MKNLVLIIVLFPYTLFGQVDCGQKPVFSFNDLDENSIQHQTFLQELKIWEECVEAGGIGYENNQINNSEKSINSFEFIYIPDLNYSDGSVDKFNYSKKIRQFFNGIGLKAFGPKNIPSKIQNDNCLALYASIDHTNASLGKANEFIISLSDCNGEIYVNLTKSAYLGYRSNVGNTTKALEKVFNELSLIFQNYSYNPAIKIEKENLPTVEFIDENEESLKEYYDTNYLHELEGIFTILDGTYRIGIKKINDSFKAIILNSKSANWKIGEVKFSLELTATNNLYSLDYFLNNKEKISSFLIVKNPGILEFTLEVNNQEIETNFIKIYPTTSTKKNITANTDWTSNGSGVIVSESGHIITNHHVIDEANKVEVEFILNDEVQKFNAEIVQSDKVNDLAIIKIVDVNFDGVKEITYNFKTRSSDVGTKVYAYGYPMALSIMGKEIKVTDGIISSKTGFDGDITTYQITAPIQGGNSGGPLFDDKGNLIGINSSGIRKDIADNVGYSIKTNYVLNLIDILPKSIDLPSSTKLSSLPLTEQIKEISKYVVLIKVK